MATNPHFQSHFSDESGNLDSEIYRDLIEEMIQIKGRDFIYLPRNVENFDEFFLEDRHPSSFGNAITIEMLLENTQEWGGQKDLYSKFGLEIRDQANVVVSKRRFEEEVTTPNPEIVRPREGDVLIMPVRYDKRVRAFEISYVENESVFYQLGDLPIYRLTIRNFEYSGESFQTGIDSVDAYQTDYTLTTTINVSGIVGVFAPGETLTSGSWSADLIQAQGPSLVMANQRGELTSNATITGSISLATCIYDQTETSTGNDTTKNDNDVVVSEDVVDFSESNPFSGY